MPDCSPADAARGLNAATLVVLDVREPDECAVATIQGTLCIPMGEIPARTNELPRDLPIAVLCHHGMRSAQVAAFLERAGFSTVFNIPGGIDRWSIDVDPSIPRY